MAPTHNATERVAAATRLTRLTWPHQNGPDAAEKAAQILEDNGMLRLPDSTSTPEDYTGELAQLRAFRRDAEMICRYYRETALHALEDALGAHEHQESIRRRNAPREITR